jgi:beta-galactosidase GanA
LPPVGARVVVPLGSRLVTGIVIELIREAPDARSIKPIKKILDADAFVPADVVALARWTAEYYAAGVGDTIPALLPPMARGARVDAHKTVRIASITAAGLEALNAAWGNRFWSMEYRSFDEIDLPMGAVTELNPSHRLDFFRFSSDQVASFNAEQVAILRELSPDRFVTHNFMGAFLDFDHWKLGAGLDFASWDSYPLGFTDTAPMIERADKERYAQTGHPDISAFHHDLYRGVGRGKFWVMEQQPGPVNWARWNPSPAPGMVRLWAWEALAHGAEVVSFFRWRQVPFAQEQMHAGLNRPDNVLDVGGVEAARVAAELKSAWWQEASRAAVAKAPVALVFDYESAWIARIVMPFTVRSTRQFLSPIKL